MRQIYYGDFTTPHWKNGEVNWDCVQREFDIVKTEPEVIYAGYYDDYGYSGDAVVLYKEDGKLWYVDGGHCSCYGLEGQWDPDEVTVEQITHMIKESKYGYFANHREELLSAVKELA